jgi:hypothetical protein
MANSLIAALSPLMNKKAASAGRGATKAAKGAAKSSAKGGSSKAVKGKASFGNLPKKPMARRGK